MEVARNCFQAIYIKIEIIQQKFYWSESGYHLANTSLPFDMIFTYEVSVDNGWTSNFFHSFILYFSTFYVEGRNIAPNCPKLLICGRCMQFQLTMHRSVVSHVRKCLSAFLLQCYCTVLKVIETYYWNELLKSEVVCFCIRVCKNELTLYPDNSSFGLISAVMVYSILHCSTTERSICQKYATIYLINRLISLEV
jgi:hypothetical protein